ncbi:uncharacterized protein [Dendropsophus ebraccatus]|uniref:uncharacterized protein n=1 Tax=Dendropsophus ebraccatus TaxID=150705 RepID=UPI00383131B1
MEIRELTQYIKGFSLDRCERGGRVYERILLQLFGFLGHGKSSFINSCKYVLEDTDYVNHAGADMSDAGRTRARVSYKLTDCITLVDNRGCAKMDSYETGEIFAQLANILPLDEPVEWSRGLRLVDRIVESEQNVRSSDFIFPLFLYSIKKGIHESEAKDLEKLLKTAKKLTGIFPIIVLTYKTWGSLTKIEGIFRNLGAEKIYALENYTPEDHLRTRGRHEAVLRLLYEVIKQVEFCLEEAQDPIQEMKDRKQFILRFIYEREVENQQHVQESVRCKEQWKEKKDTSCPQDQDHTEREEDRRHFEEEMRRLRESFEFQRQCDAQRHDAELRGYQRQIELLQRKDNCVIQ